MTNITAVVFSRTPGPLVDRCVRSVSSFADEILIVNSASAVGLTFQWGDAFDDLYNFGVAKVSSGWVLVINEDEFLQDGAQKKILKAIESGSSLAFRFTIEEKGSSGIRKSEAIRLWKSDPSVRFLGCVYPELSVSESVLLDVRIIHEPTLTDDERTARNTPLVRKELELRPGSLRYQAILAQLLAAESPDESAVLRHCVVDCIIRDSNVQLPLGLASWLFIEELQNLSENELLSPRTDAIVRAAWRVCGRSPNVIWAIANCEQKRGDIFYAMYAWLEIDDLLSTRTFDPSCPPDPVVQSAALYRNLGQSAIMIDRLDVAQRSLKRALAIDPNDAAARLLLARV